MRYSSKRQQYENSTRSNEIRIIGPNPYAISYGWWKYWTLEQGVSIFNHYHYSNSTSKHQRAALRMIAHVDVTLHHTAMSLGDPAAAVRDEIALLQRENIQLQARIDAPRTHRARNEERAKEIVVNNQTIAQLKDVLTRLEEDT